MSVSDTDIVVVGAGLAGLSFALYASQSYPQATISVYSKAPLSETNTYKAQGGVAAVMNHSHDSFAAHIEDTLKAGDGLSDPDIVRLVVEEAPQRMRDLMSWGLVFDHRGGRLELAREGGHSAERVLHVRDHSGRSILKALLAACSARPNIRIIENQSAESLLLDEFGSCRGLLLRMGTKIHRIVADHVVLATGGAGNIYRRSSNPQAATGDGLALALHAGAKLRNMAFVQFHPTVFPRKEERDFLISEALRGFGAVLRDSRNRAFMLDYHPLGNLATRDIVSRAIYQEMAKSGEDHVYLDLRHLDYKALEAQFPTIMAVIKAEDPALYRKGLIPVSPAAHYFCGGIETDAWAQTTIPNLLAIGEVACTGLHGANRLASNSLLEALVFAYRAVQGLALNGRQSGKLLKPASPALAFKNADLKIRALQELMYEKVGVYRDQKGLQEAQALLKALYSEGDIEAKPRPIDSLLANMLTVAKAVVDDSLSQSENRGAFYCYDLEELSSR